jgi:hypothetical protein
LTLAIFTGDGPPGAEEFLYLNRAPEPFELHPADGRLNVTGPLPSSKVSEESAPPTGSEPVMLMLASFESKTNFPGLLSSSFFPVMPWSAAFAKLPARSRKTDMTIAWSLHLIGLSCLPLTLPSNVALREAGKCLGGLR